MATDKARLTERLEETIGMLRTFAVLFDGGNKVTAKDMAVKLRVLFHDTKWSVSLLKQLGVKEKFCYVDSALPIDVRSVSPAWGLVLVHQINGLEGRESIQYEAPLDNLSPRRVKPPLNFNEWWSTKIIKDSQGNQLSREDGGLKNVNGSPVEESVRQIAYEVLRTFDEQSEVLRNYRHLTKPATPPNHALLSIVLALVF